MSDLPEHPDERRWFDRAAKLHGSPLAAVAATLSNWSAISPPQGSYAQQLAIMSNEVSRAAARLAAAEKAVADEQAKTAAAEAREALLVGALQASLKAYLDLASSGDCGFWDPEGEEHVQASRAALTTSGSALAQAIERVVTSHGSTEDLCKAVAALRDAWGQR